MFSFQRLLGRENEFFGPLEASAQECVASISALRDILARPGEAPSLEAFAAARRKDKEITQRLEEMLIRTFVTPIEREDIEELADRLYKIPKTVEKFAERFALVVDKVQGVPFEFHAEPLERAVQLVLAMIRGLRAGNLAEVKARQTELRTLARIADIAMAEALEPLYQRSYGPLRAVIVKDLYELLERAMERCREAAAVIAHILIKNS